MGLIHPGLSWEIPTLGLRDPVPFLTPGWLQRVSGQSLEVALHPQRPQCTTKSLQRWGMEGLLLPLEHRGGISRKGGFLGRPSGNLSWLLCSEIPTLLSSLASWPEASHAIKPGDSVRLSH